VKHSQWLDANSHHEDRRRVIKLLVDIASASNELPRTLFLRGVQLHSFNPTSCGAYADVFRGSWKGTTVALKRLRFNDSGQMRDQIHKVRR
jgi:hypothetical protein